MAKTSLYGGRNVINFDGRKHVYTLENHKTQDGTDLMIPGVTKILGRLAKEALIPWASNMAADYFRDSLLSGHEDSEPDHTIGITVGEINDIHKDAKGAYRRKSAAAADVGKLVHKYAEDWLKGDRKPELKTKKKLSDEDLEKYHNGTKAFRSWWDNHDIEVDQSERVIFSERWLYAGTTDFWGRINGEKAVLDFKTSSGLYPEMAIQIAAYRIALEEELGIRIPVGYLVRFDKLTGECITHKIQRSEMHADAFLALRELHEKLTRMERFWVVQ
jgi:CRISPR/Cas system-associated exonuclease Cas4 (RecB family)